MAETWNSNSLKIINTTEPTNNINTTNHMPLMYKNPKSHGDYLLPSPEPTPPQPLLLSQHTTISHDQNHRPDPNPSMFASTNQIMLATAAWLRTRRSRCLFLLFCSPLLLPFICATFPLLCAGRLFMRICRRGRRKEGFVDGEERLRRCEEGACDCGGLGAEEDKEIGLLQRYLEDQLRLVGSVYECGDEFDDDDDDPDTRNLEYSTPLLG